MFHKTIPDPDALEPEIGKAAVNEHLHDCRTKAAVKDMFLGDDDILDDFGLIKNQSFIQGFYKAGIHHRGVDIFLVKNFCGIHGFVDRPADADDQKILPRS